MGLLDSLNPINLVKSAAESIVDSVLPEGLKALGNDLVDVALDVVGGNYAGLGKDVGSFLHDAETAMAPLTNLATALPKPTTEPDAPPASASAPEPQTTSGATATDAQSDGTTLSTTSSSITAPSGGETGPATLAAADGGDSVTTTVSAADDKSTSESQSETKSSGSKSTKTKSTKTNSSSSSSKSTSSSTSDAKDVTKFFAQSDTELMAAVRDGKLPDAVKDDPAAMQRLQLRMNEIAEMNQLISQMLAAMHDMNKAVIQNIRA